MTYYKYANVDGLKIFYREAGDPKQPTILLLHGFPTSSHMFRDLIPLAVGPLSRVAIGKSATRRIMADLIWDIPSAVRSYPEWQEYLRSRQPRTFVVWARRDPVFEPAGAEAIRQAVPTADVIYYDTGHFALEENGRTNRP